MCLLGMSCLLDPDPSLCHVGSFHSWFILCRVSPWCFNTLQGFCHLLLLLLLLSNCGDGLLTYFLFISRHHPRSGLLLPPTLGCSWNCAAVIAWLGFALAASCAFLRCLRFAKPRYTERNLRWVQFHVSHVSPA